ncbi:MAG TPA: hypothetical protein VFS97_03545 [Nitrososphaeraceae archaeon]|nr:hypothetical protein [Nitrososphaeraceae archaeon]
MYTSKGSNLFILVLVIVPAVAPFFFSSYAQREKPEDNPFVVVFTVAGVDKDTGFVANWVTANNVTRIAYYNASEVDLKDTNPRTRNDGFVEGAVTLPNGTLQVGEEYTACSIIFKDAHVTCDKGFNAPTNRAEFADVSIPSSSRK